MGTEDMTEPDQLVPGQGAEQKKGLDTRLWVLNLLKNTLFGFLLFLDDYRKCDPQEHVPAGPTLGCQLTLSALGVSPLPRHLAFSGAICPSLRPCEQKPYLEEVARLFSMQRTMKALWQLAAFCSSSLPASSEDAWPVAVAASVLHVSQ